MKKDEWKGNIISYKGEGECELRGLLGGKEVWKMYRVRSSTQDLSDKGG